MDELNSPLPEVDAELLRRQHARLRLGIPARFETLDGRQQVRLVDLSHGGAQIEMESEAPVREGVLSWMLFETFGIAAWQDGSSVGLTFDRPLSRTALRMTHDKAPEIFLEAARQFVAGTDGTLR
ncbi:MAG: PilZ domain-containing protein [Croceibacterium sp.]|jgi:hypothetical protein